ncbi:nickel-responsive transcriptional regulator NikR [Xanthobacter sp. ZOL 2024]
MQRTTITLDDDLAADLDAYMQATGAMSRSEAIRDLVRRGLSTRSGRPAEAHCFGIVSCTVDQAVRNLAARVPQGRLERHDQTVAALSVPLDHTTSIDIAVMRGHVADVSAYAEALFLERGVMHGALNLIPVVEDKVPHSHAEGTGTAHTHLRVRSGF